VSGSILFARLTRSTKRSHFIFEKGSGKLVEAKLGVKPADE
jgi:peroxiredoxin Q/BCP